MVTNYNVMGVAKAALECSVRYLAQDLGQDGIRVNAISAGPLKTLAAAGIKGMRAMLGENAAKTPLRRNIEHEDVGSAALYLCSELAERDGRDAPRRRRPEHHGRRDDGSHRSGRVGSLADERVVAALVAERASRSVPGEESDVVAER